ncbi:hypothetical protein BDV18DRAFT_59988 [Aspergillus unguis]
MCNFDIIVYLCGHYDKSLDQPCDEAKRRRTLCSAAYKEDPSATQGCCGISGCDKILSARREGPRKIPSAACSRVLLQRCADIYRQGKGGIGIPCKEEPLLPL